MTLHGRAVAIGAGMRVEIATDVRRAGRVGASLGAVVPGLGLAACGDDDSDGSGGGPDSEASGTENCAALDDTLAEGTELFPGGAVMVPEGWEIPDCRGDGDGHSQRWRHEVPLRVERDAVGAGPAVRRGAQRVLLCGG